MGNKEPLNIEIRNYVRVNTHNLKIFYDINMIFIMIINHLSNIKDINKFYQIDLNKF